MHDTPLKYGVYNGQVNRFGKVLGAFPMKFPTTKFEFFNTFCPFAVSH